VAWVEAQTAVEVGRLHLSLAKADGFGNGEPVVLQALQLGDSLPAVVDFSVATLDAYDLNGVPLAGIDVQIRVSGR